ncbi:uncharacterized protein [Aegilops tauschii subsp. strangulata]|uniref:Alkyl transferase n=1 Tax=Aegilops tauschii TaxID=37682 RepID=M8BYZ8_AEGTA
MQLPLQTRNALQAASPFQQRGGSSSSHQTRRTAAPPCLRVRASIGLPAEGILPVGLRVESLPRHVAVTIDGNSRWAQARGMPTSAGHAALQPALEETVRLSRAWGIRVLTVFAFSDQNWNRPKEEVDFAMGVFDRFIQDNVAQFVRKFALKEVKLKAQNCSNRYKINITFIAFSMPCSMYMVVPSGYCKTETHHQQEEIIMFCRDGIRLHVIGDLSRLPTYLQKTAHDAEEETRSNSQIDLMLGISYGGRADILQACKKIAQKVYNKLLRPKDIDDSLFADELQTSWTDEFPYPDLLIRTSGELRLSDFMLWQSAYTELFFTDTLWPDFGEAEYLEALMSFQSRDRRFGKRKL